ncbi:MAG: peptidase S41 [Ruminococcaceae bacterium]|nr:peptidase S41 [Oscillospiraceae bacterium]
MENLDLVLALLLIVFSAALFVISKAAEKRVTQKWRICYAAPVMAGLVIVGIAGFDSYMLTAYLAAIVLLAGFFVDNGRLRRVASVIAAALAIVTIPVCTMSKGYRAYDYVQDFKDSIKSMESHYVLADHKEIDFDALYDEFLPRFEAVNSSQDEQENLIVWTELCARFNDGHVGYISSKDHEKAMTDMYDKVLGNDYGLAPMTLSDGRTAAVNVEPDSEAYKAGIRNGTIITSWDGVSPENISDEAMKYFSFADKDNKEFFRTLLCGGTGGDSITIGFIDESGKEKTAELTKLGAYYSGRLESAFAKITGGIETGHLMWEDIDEKTSAFRIKMMMADSTSMESGDYRGLKYDITSKLEELKSQGKDHVILDMRDNSGGDGGMVKAIASIFAPVGEHYYCTDALWSDAAGGYVTDENGRFIKDKDNYVTGEDLWDGKLTIIVNHNSVSAADHLVEVMQGMPDVTIIGFTEPNGSAQGVGGLMFDNDYVLSFSGSLLLDENGDVSVDSGSDHESGNDIDIRVPFDEEALHIIFDEGKDHLLLKALEMYE